MKSHSSITFVDTDAGTCSLYSLNQDCSNKLRSLSKQSFPSTTIFDTDAGRHSTCSSIDDICCEDGSVDEPGHSFHEAQLRCCKERPHIGALRTRSNASSLAPRTKCPGTNGSDPSLELL